MLDTLTGRYSFRDFETAGRPDLSDHDRLRDYEQVIFAQANGWVGHYAPTGVQNAAGETIIPQDKVNPKNLLRDAANWYVEAMMASPPTLTGGAFAGEREEDLRRILRRCVIISAVIGHGVLYVVDGQIYIVPGQNVFPILERGNPLPMGYVLAFPYYARPPQDPGGQHRQPPNRLRVVAYDAMTGETERRTHVYQGNVIGDVEPDPQQDDRLPITAFATFGSTEGFFQAALPLAQEIVRLDAVIRELCTTYSIPIPVINPAVTRGGATGLLNAQGQPVMQGQRNALTDNRPDAPPLELIAAMPEVGMLAEEREQWLERLHAATRIPYQITAQAHDTEMAAISRELSAKPATDYIAEITRSIGLALTTVVSSIAGSLTVEWNADPFATAAETRMEALGAWNAGVATLNETREELDWPAVPGGDVFKGFDVGDTDDDMEDTE